MSFRALKFRVLALVEIEVNVQGNLTPTVMAEIATQLADQWASEEATSVGMFTGTSDYTARLKPKLAKIASLRRKK